MMEGYAAPFVRIFYNDKELSQQVEKMSYIYDEEGEDECKITIRDSDPSIVDRPEYQEMARIKVTWGYTSGPSVTRIVYWTDIEWTFDKDGLTGNLKGNEKAVALKQTTDTKIHKKTSLPAVVNQMADKHGLNAYMEVQNSKPKPVKKTDSKYVSLKDYFPQFKDNGESEKIALNEKKKEQARREGVARQDENIRRNSEDYHRFEKQLNDYYLRKQIPPKEFLQRNAGFVRIYRSQIKQFDIVPQAGKSDKQFLKELADQSSIDPTVIDTRDDDIIIRKRNFNQKPYRKYIYKGDDGNLLSFSPETKSKNNKSNTVNIVYGGWDSEKKQFKTDVANSDTSNTQTILNDYLPKGDLGFIKDFGRLNGVTQSENTNVRKYLIIKELDDAKNKKQFFGPRANEESANSRRDSGDIKKNPGKTLMVGDPNITVGQLFTFENVGKKYSGNYYSIKSTHEVIPQSGYMTTLEIARQGQNIKANSNDKSAKEARKLINKQMGVDKESIRKKVQKSNNKR